MDLKYWVLDLFLNKNVCNCFCILDLIYDRNILIICIIFYKKV